MRRTAVFGAWGLTGVLAGFVLGFLVASGGQERPDRPAGTEATTSTDSQANSEASGDEGSAFAENGDWWDRIDDTDEYNSADWLQSTEREKVLFSYLAFQLTDCHAPYKWYTLLDDWAHSAQEQETGDERRVLLRKPLIEILDRGKEILDSE